MSGIQLVHTPEEVKAVTSMMAGKHLMNRYTPTKGLICRSVLIMEEVSFSDKFFVLLSLDTRTNSPMLTYSKQGGHPLERLLDMFPHTVKKH